jgi:hypothetical protein
MQTISNTSADESPTARTGSRFAFFRGPGVKCVGMEGKRIEWIFLRSASCVSKPFRAGLAVLLEPAALSV